MLSSISSFLPSALQIGADKSPPSSSQSAPLTESPTKADEDMAVDEHGVKKKKERTNEVCYYSSWLSSKSSASSPPRVADIRLDLVEILGHAVSRPSRPCNCSCAHTTRTATVNIFTLSCVLPIPDHFIYCST